jgi:membrane-bound ClpP family serine protease
MNFGIIPFRRHAMELDVKRLNTKLIKRTVTDWLKVIVFLLDDVVALLLIILLLRFLKIQIPLPIIIVVAILIGTLLFIIHRAILPDFRRKPVTGQEGMIGSQGSVVKPLSPIGTVIVEGEHWKAKSVDGSIGVGENVEIVGLDGLTLKVKRKKR